MPFISDKPIPFIELHSTTSGKEEWRITNRAMQVLESIEDEVSVVGIVGKYRTGKSYIMNRLFNVKKGGFDLGHPVKGHTRGIWLWGTKSGHSTMLALDTEGLYDTENDSDRDIQLFSLSILLTTVLIINFSGALDTGIIDQLGLVTRLTEMLHSDSDGDDFNTFFPNLIFLARDFNLKIPDDCGDEQGYLKSALKESKGISSKTRELNAIRSIIKEVFPRILLRTLITPVDNPEENLDKMMSDPYLVKSKFIQQVETVMDDIDRFRSIKSVNNIPLTGRLYASIAQSYVNAMNNNEQMSIPNAFESVCRVEIEKAVDVGFDHYIAKWKETVESFPMAPELLEKKNEEYMTTSIDVALKQVKIANIHETIRIRIKERIKGTDDSKGKYHDYMEENNRSSIEFCTKKSRELYESFVSSSLPEVKTEDSGQLLFRKLHEAYLEVALGVGTNSAWELISKEFEKDINIHLERLKMKEKENAIIREKAIETGVSTYVSQWKDLRGKFPISMDDFTKHHEQTIKKAIDAGLENVESIPDSSATVEEGILKKITGTDGKRIEFEQENSEKSKEFCSKKAFELYVDFKSTLSEYKNEESAKSKFEIVHKKYLEVAVGVGIEDAWTPIEKDFSKDLTIHMERLKIKQREEELEKERRVAEEARRAAERRADELREESRRQQEQMWAMQRRQEQIMQQMRQDQYRQSQFLQAQRQQQLRQQQLREQQLREQQFSFSSSDDSDDPCEWGENKEDDNRVGGYMSMAPYYDDDDDDDESW